MKKIFAIAATAVALSALAGCYIGKAEFKGEDMVRQAKLGRSNRMKGVCTAKKTKCR